MTDKRFFRFEDAKYGEPYYIVVAVDLDHAKRILRESQVEFGDPSLPLDQLPPGAYEWSEIHADRAATKMVDFNEDGRGRIPLAECAVGDWFCSEY